MKNKNALKSLILSLALFLSICSGAFQVLGASNGNAVPNDGTGWAIGQMGKTETINIVAINDFHGNVLPSSSNPGIAKIAGYLNGLKEENQTFFFSAGDSFQGTAISNLTQGEVVNEAFQLMGLKASAIGNHEYDWGYEMMYDWSEEGGYPFLASNIVYKDSGEPVDYADPYMIQNITLKSGKVVKIGYIGIATPETETKTAAANVADIDFTDPMTAANKWAKYLRTTEKVDAVVALTHLGGFQDKDTKEISGELYDFAMGVKGIDLILSGHTHQVIDGIVNGIQVLQGQYNGRSLQVGQLIFNNRNRKLVAVDGYVPNLRNMIPELPEDPKVAALVNQYNEDLSSILNEYIGYNARELEHDTSIGLTPMGQWSAKTLAELGGTQVGLFNGGGIRGGLPVGDITMATMYSLFPFDNTMVTMEVSGTLLTSLIEHLIVDGTAKAGQYYGVKATVDLSQDLGKRVVGLTLLDGTPVDPDGTYTLSTIDFMYTGGDTYNFTGATNVIDSFLPVRDLLTEYIRAAGTIDYTFDPSAFVLE